MLQLGLAPRSQHFHERNTGRDSDKFLLAANQLRQDQGHDVRIACRPQQGSPLAEPCLEGREALGVECRAGRPQSLRKPPGRHTNVVDKLHVVVPLQLTQQVEEATCARFHTRQNAAVTLLLTRGELRCLCHCRGPLGNGSQ